jgi:signal transduction histidine kinase
LRPGYQGIGKVGGAIPEWVSAAIAVITDVTNIMTSPENQLEQALRDSQARFDRLAANVPGAIYQYILRPDGSQAFTYISPSSRDLYEQEPQDLVNDFGLAFAAIHPDDRAGFVESVKVSAETLQAWNHEWRTITPSGQQKWLQGCSRPEKQPNGEIIWDGILLDITERKHEELKRKQAERQLQRSEAQFRAMAKREALLNALATQIRESLDLDTILETAVFHIRQLLQIDRCNFSWYYPALYHPQLEIIKEDKEPELDSILGEYDVSGITATLEKLKAGQEIRVDDVNRCDDPDLRQFLTNLGFTSAVILPMRTHLGEMGVLSCGHCQGLRPWHEPEIELVEAVVAQLAIALNQAELYRQTQLAAIDAQQQANESERMLRELQRTQGQLIQSEKLSSLGQLVAGVAHEINNPVNFIYGNIAHAKDYIQDLMGLIELYQETYPETTPELEEEIDAIDLDFLLEDLPKLLKSMEVGAERIREIVQSLRNFSRTDEAEMKAVDIHDGIDSTLMILQNRIKAKPNRPAIAVVKHYSDLPKVECYPGQLNQVFMNLISNSIDALEEYDEKRYRETMKADPSTITITTEVVQGDQVKIKIADNGSGISESVKKTIFDPFITTKPIGKGTGLGLAISYQIITEKHGGEIVCNSTKGEGAEFVITIPIEQPAMIS